MFSLSFNDISNDVASTIAEGLRSNQTLEELMYVAGLQAMYSLPDSFLLKLMFL